MRSLQRQLVPTVFCVLRSLALCLGCQTAATLVACGGKSISESPDGAPSKGGASASSGSASSPQNGSAAAGARQSDGCSYDGVQYSPGQTFGECDHCKCAGDLGVVCSHRVCSAGAGGTANAAGGSSSGAAGTAIGASSGMGGAAPGGAGGSAGGASGGRGSSQYDYVPLDYFCLAGPKEGGEISVGMRLVIYRHPGGCHPSSCTTIGDADCHSVGSDHQFWVSGLVGLATQGEACTGDCSIAAVAVCDLGYLTAGEYSVSLSGVAAPSLRFTVPSHVTNAADLCVSIAAP